jgi:hypothetical protein
VTNRPGESVVTGPASSAVATTQVPAPFRIRDCAITIVALGHTAFNLRELRNHIASVPATSISHHFYDALLRPSFDDRDFRNDFAAWVRRQLRDERLAEILGVLDPLDEGQTIEEVRDRLLEILDDRLHEMTDLPQVGPGREFRFLRSQFVVFDTALEARTPEELGARVRAATTGSVYYHFIDARWRTKNRQDDYTLWLEGWGDGTTSRRARLAQIDFQMWSLPELRDRIAAACDHEAGG